MPLLQGRVDLGAMATEMVGKANRNVKRNKCGKGNGKRLADRSAKRNTIGKGNVKKKILIEMKRE